MNNIRKAYILLFFLLIPMVIKADWVAYDFFSVGTKGLGIGGANVSLSDDMGAFYSNPAGLFQIEKPTFSYQMYSILKVQRLINTKLQVEWELFPLLAYAVPIKKNKMTAGIFIQTLFKSLNESYTVYGTGVSYSYRLFERFAMGINLGLAVGSQESNWATGYFWQIGLIYQLSDKVKAGMIVRSSINLQWDLLRGAPNVDETLPWSAQMGVSIRITQTSILSIDLEYQGISSIRYKAEGIVLNPDLDTGLFKNLHPHIGFQFLHKPSGAQFRFGFMTLANASSSGIESQPVITLGIGGYTSNSFKIDFTLQDSLIFDIFTRTNRFERFLLSFEYTF